jgi:glycosyltransferase involved in cell wall biosynthesis
MVIVAALTYGLPVLLQMALVTAVYLVSVVATGAFRVADLNSLRPLGVGIADLVIDGQDPGSRRAVAPTYASVRDAVTGIRTAHVHSTRPVPWGVLAAARVAGVHQLEIHRAAPITRRERWRLEFFADQVHLGEPPPPAEVLFVNEGALGSGVLGHLTALASLHAGLDAAGVRHDIEVIGGPQRLGERIWSRGVPILGSLDLDFQPSRWHAVMARRTRRIVRRHAEPKQLVVVAHTIAFGLLPTLRRVPSYVFVDATVRQWASLGLWRKARPWTSATLWWSLRQERKVFRSATVVAFSEWAAEGVRAEVPDADIAVLSPGIDTDRFRPADEPRPPDGPMRILFVGGRFAEKGGFDLLEATAEMRPSRATVDVVTAADIGTHAGVRVHRLTGAAPELVELYQRADVLCLPTRADGSPFVVLEALASATPVISTPIGAIPSLVGPAGTIVAVGDVGGLRTAIEALADDEGLNQNLSRAARLRAVERFSAVRQGARLAELLAHDR